MHRNGLLVEVWIYPGPHLVCRELRVCPVEDCTALGIFSGPDAFRGRALLRYVVWNNIPYHVASDTNANGHSILWSCITNSTWTSYLRCVYIFWYAESILAVGDWALLQIKWSGHTFNLGYPSMFLTWPLSQAMLFPPQTAAWNSNVQVHNSCKTLPRTLL